MPKSAEEQYQADCAAMDAYGQESVELYYAFQKEVGLTDVSFEELIKRKKQIDRKGIGYNQLSESEQTIVTLVDAYQKEMDNFWSSKHQGTIPSDYAFNVDLNNYWLNKGKFELSSLTDKHFLLVEEDGTIDVENKIDDELLDDALALLGGSEASLDMAQADRSATQSPTQYSSEDETAESLSDSHGGEQFTLDDLLGAIDDVMEVAQENTDLEIQKEFTENPAPQGLTRTKSSLSGSLSYSSDNSSSDLSVDIGSEEGEVPWWQEKRARFLEGTQILDETLSIDDAAENWYALEEKSYYLSRAEALGSIINVRLFHEAQDLDFAQQRAFLYVGSLNLQAHMHNPELMDSTEVEQLKEFLAETLATLSKVATKEQKQELAEDYNYLTMVANLPGFKNSKDYLTSNVLKKLQKITGKVEVSSKADTPPKRKKAIINTNMKKTQVSALDVEQDTAVTKKSKKTIKHK